jgi:hypothetical protein
MSEATAVLTPLESIGTIHEIDRRSSADLPYDLFLKEYLEPNRPVIIENAAPQWNAMRAWTPAFFKSRFGSQLVNVSYTTKMKMADLIDAVMASTPEKPGPYLHKVLIYSDMPELLADLSPDSDYAFPRRYASPLMPKRFQRPDGFLKLLIGGAGGKFPLMHFDTDNSHAMITEMYGDKSFVLFAPEDTEYMYPFGDSDHTSQIENPDNADLTKFPLFANATQYRGTVHPGDAILIPSGWWHAARALNPSISVCTNMMYRSNWPGFVDQNCSPVNVTSGVRRLTKRAYLNALGMVLTGFETIQRTLPNTAISNKAAGFAPLFRRELPTEVRFPKARRAS